MASKFMKSIKDRQQVDAMNEGKREVQFRKLKGAVKKASSHNLKIIGPNIRIKNRPAIARAFGNYKSKPTEY